MKAFTPSLQEERITRLGYLSGWKFRISRGDMF